MLGDEKANISVTYKLAANHLYKVNIYEMTSKVLSSQIFSLSTYAILWYYQYLERAYWELVGANLVRQEFLSIYLLPTRMHVSINNPSHEDKTF